MTRSTLLGLAVLVLAGLGALWFLVIRDEPGAGTTPPAPAPTESSTSRPTGHGPSLPAGAPRLAPATGSARPDTTGMTVTDRRTPGEDVVIPGTGSAAARGPRIAQALTRSVHANASTIVLGCARKVAPNDRGEKPRIGAQLVVAISDGNLRVTDVTPETTDLSGPEVEAAKACVKDTLINLEVPAPDEPDIDGYALHLSYTVR